MTPDAGAETESARLRWRCRRGMKELDELLVAWLEHRYAAASSRERVLFHELIELPDPVLAGYLLGRETPSSPEVGALVAAIARHHA
jgi:antitoxin CptB